MPLSDILYVFQWWLVLLIGGIFFLPITGKIFSVFQDKGYAFSKILAIIAISYIVYILGLLKILAFTPINIYIVFIVSSIVILLTNRKGLKFLFTKKTMFLFITEEAIFFLCLLAWSYIRGHNPEIYGLEKYMDFGFVNSILRSKYFPPVDMWYTPNPINYYYFGHFYTALITKASGIPSVITYNLMIASVFALAFIESFSIGLTLIAHKSKYFGRALFGGLLIAGLVSLSGNLHIIYTFFKTYEVDKPQPPWELQFSLNNPCFNKTSYVTYKNDGTEQITNCSLDEQRKQYLFPNSYWYPNATRFIHNTIHEFPIYSWVVADLHGHVTDIPIVLLTISVLLTYFLKIQSPLIDLRKLDTNEKNNDLLSSKQNISFKIKNISKSLISYSINYNLRFSFLFLFGFLLAVMYMTNAWDGLTYLILTLCVLTYLNISRVYIEKERSEFLNPFLILLPNKKAKEKIAKFLHDNNFIDFLTGIVFTLFVVIAAFVFFALPFSLNFDSSKIVGGIGVVGAPSILLEKNAVNIGDQTYGLDNRNFLAKILIPDHCKSILSSSELSKITTSYSARKIGPFLFEPDHCLRSPWWQLLILYGFFYFFVISLIIYVYNKKKINDAFVFVFFLISVSSMLIIIPEFFYMKDIYPDHYRANTMFKLVFQAFIMLSIVSGFTIIKTISKVNFRLISLKQKPIYILYIFLTIILLSLVFTYPYFAITSYYNSLSTYDGLNGLKYLKNRSPDDYEAIVWLNSNISGQPVVLEAQGDSYTDYERISANTGLPTVLGWYVHEWLWRGIDAPKTRADHVRDIYESGDQTITKNLLKKYNISYIVVGKLEKEKYPMTKEEKFELLGIKVFQAPNSSIYKIN